MGMHSQVLYWRVMLKTTTQHSWCSWSLDNCIFLLLSHRGLSWRLLRFPILVGRKLDINLVEINLWNILQPPLLQCSAHFLHRCRIDLEVIRVGILLVDNNSSSRGLPRSSRHIRDSLLVFNLLGDGIVLKEWLVELLYLWLLQGSRGDVAHQYLLVNGCCLLQRLPKLRLMWCFWIVVQSGISWTSDAAAVHIK